MNDYIECVDCHTVHLGRSGQRQFSFKSTISGLVVDSKHSANLLDDTALDAFQRILSCHAANKSFDALTDDNCGLYPGKVMVCNRDFYDTPRVVILCTVGEYSLVVDEELWGTRFNKDKLQWVFNQHLHPLPTQVPSITEVTEQITRHIGIGIDDDFGTVVSDNQTIIYHKPSKAKFSVSVQEVK